MNKDEFIKACAASNFKARAKAYIEGKPDNYNYTIKDLSEVMRNPDIIGHGDRWHTLKGPDNLNGMKTTKKFYKD